MRISATANYYFYLATEKSTLSRALRVAILVGIILNLINNPAVITSFSFVDVHVGRVILTFVVPFLVSTYSSVLTGGSMKPGKTSRIDALLKCNSCKTTSFSVNVGQTIDECPTCKKNTRWRLKKLFSFAPSGHEMLKSLALFARHNPQPLFRLDEKGVIIGANPASEEIFGKSNLSGMKLEQYVPEVREINFENLVETEGVEDLILEINGHHYRFLFKGVVPIHTVHVYGNDITEIVKAERKIRSQAQEINSSIRYAWRIQKSLLPGNAFMSEIFPVSFVFYRPRNVVSGDFYWVNKIGDIKIIAVADCTGHGVPGAFMSMLGISLLNEIVLREEITDPDRILNEMRRKLIEALTSQQDDAADVSDGMDMAIVTIDVRESTMSYSGAFNPLLLCRDGSLHIFEADRMPVGKFYGEMKSFSVKDDIVKKGDRIFLFSDGYQDQFGGDKDKKFSQQGLKELIVRTDPLSMDQVSESIQKEFDQWKRDSEQVDDVLVVGIEF